MADSRLTPVEQKMYDVLRDGEVHTKEELLKCLVDDLGDPDKNVKARVNYLRKKLAKKGLDVVWTNGERKGYRLMRTINQSEE